MSESISEVPEEFADKQMMHEEIVQKARLEAVKTKLSEKNVHPESMQILSLIIGSYGSSISRTQIMEALKIKDNDFNRRIIHGKILKSFDKYKKIFQEQNCSLHFVRGKNGMHYSVVLSA